MSYIYIYRIYKIMQLISNFLYKKKMFPSMQIHVHYVNLMKQQFISKFQKHEILNQKSP